jgi:hypothetical protein
VRRLGGLLIALALLAGGCGQRYDVRTGELTLNRALSRAFKRDYAAAHRMRTGRADRSIVRHADVRCREREPQPSDDSRPWRWRCRVRWYLRGDPRAGIATYGARVDERGCFEARSGAFPDRIPERILRRRGPNPLVYIRSCP